MLNYNACAPLNCGNVYYKIRHTSKDLSHWVATLKNQLTNVIAGIIISVIVETCGTKTADYTQRTGPDKLVADLALDHGVPHLITGVVVGLDVGVTALDVIVRVDVWQAAGVTLHSLHHCLTVY